MPVSPLLGRRIHVRGVVQGVGFRPFVYRIASDEAVRGGVWNDAQGVTIDAFASREALERFISRLRSEAPPAARVRELDVEPLPGAAPATFVIGPSRSQGVRALAISADLATCAACEAEVFDVESRRFGYPFTNCTHCGPRLTIATGAPYDRTATTMAAFPMCALCQAEFDDVTDRRFHAQPNACPACGPRLCIELHHPEGFLPAPELDPLAHAARLLREGAIVAVKGLGGYHLACDATSQAAVGRLRACKQRDDKPFGLMVSDLEHARGLVRMSPEDAALLSSPEHPLVLAPRLPTSAIAREVAPDSAALGLLLPYTPLHHLLLRAVDRPLVMTSANRASEPICQHDDEARTRLARLADALLLHDRSIAIRCDDSIARVIDGAPVVLRRSRGYVPRAVRLTHELARPVLACGAHLKNTFCLARGHEAYLGPHVGDLDTPEALAFLHEAIERMQDLLAIEPEVIAHDLHPGYGSTRYAHSRPALLPIGVQHHHAHIASAMAEHALDGPVLGIAFDGTGYGTDGTAWGAEIMLADARGFERLATFRPLALPGGEQAIRQVWRSALALLHDAYAGDVPERALALFRHQAASKVEQVQELLRRDVFAPKARGMGRYFDAFGALILGRAEARHEGQVASALSDCAAEAEHGVYPFEVEESAGLLTLDLRPSARAVVDEVCSARSPSECAARFHNTVVTATLHAVHRIVESIGSQKVVLSGGCFQNPWLVRGLRHGLEPHLTVHVHREVPPNDGGIALGQVVVAAAQIS